MFEQKVFIYPLRTFWDKFSDDQLLWLQNMYEVS